MSFDPMFLDAVPIASYAEQWLRAQGSESEGLLSLATSGAIVGR
jgi:hypothetical protein